MTKTLGIYKFSNEKSEESGINYLPICKGNFFHDIREAPGSAKTYSPVLPGRKSVGCCCRGKRVKDQ